MKPLLNTLYVINPEAYIHQDGDNIVVSIDHKEVARYPIGCYNEIVCFNFHSISSGLMKFCGERGLMISFLDYSNHYLARLEGPVSGNIVLRKRQFDLFGDKDGRLTPAKHMIAAKIKNNRMLVMRHIRDYGENRELSKVAEGLKISQNLALEAQSEDFLRGIEGEAAARYFGQFNQFIRKEDQTFFFRGRNRRPPLDAVNALLSFGYGLLQVSCISALESVGLDPRMGLMHAIRPGKYSLALDLMEEFRSYMVDQLVLSIVNKRQLNPNHFEKREDFSVELNDKGCKIFLSEWRQRSIQKIRHPFLQENVEIGLLPYVQARILAQYVRGMKQKYVPFIVK